MDLKNYKYESSELKELYIALCSAQTSLTACPHKSVNPHFKSRYSDLATIVRHTKSILYENGFIIIQRILSTENDKSYLSTRLCHISGQYIESLAPINPPKSDIQSYGSYITYLRRYTYSSIIGLITADDSDDDGESVMDRSAPSSPPKVPCISRDQLKILSDELIGHDDIFKYILTFPNINKLSDVKEKDFNSTMNFIKQIKLKKGN